MNEARRFLRHLMPGSVFGSVLLLLTWISHPNKLCNNFLLNSELGGGALIILGLGVIGYVLSIIHHVLYHLLYSRCCLGVDLRDIHCNPHDQHNKYTGTETNKWRRGRRWVFAPLDAWCKDEVEWYPALLRDGRFNNKAYRRAQQLWDLMHSGGATLVGCVLSVLIWVYESYAWSPSGDGSWCRAFLVGLLLCALAVVNYLVSVRIVRNVSVPMSQQIKRASDKTRHGPNTEASS